MVLYIFIYGFIWCVIRKMYVYIYMKYMQIFISNLCWFSGCHGDHLGDKPNYMVPSSGGSLTQLYCVNGMSELDLTFIGCHFKMIKFDELINFLIIRMAITTLPLLWPFWKSRWPLYFTDLKYNGNIGFLDPENIY